MRVEQFINHLKNWGWRRVHEPKHPLSNKGVWVKSLDPDTGEGLLTCEIRKHRNKWLADCKLKAPRHSSIFAHQISELVLVKGWNKFNRKENFIAKLELTGFFEGK